MGGKDICIIPVEKCETIVYLVQAEIDAEARKAGLPYGEIVSTKQLQT